ncbi:RCC1 domain-containing protein [Cognatilysobacter lacus]|nr:hypothetical protein [Lysobacter lacus]
MVATHHSHVAGTPAKPDVTVLDGVVSAGAAYVVALDREGRVYGWGDGGDPNVARKLSRSDRPRQLMDGAGYRTVIAGHDSVHALDASGRLWRADLKSIWASPGAPTAPFALFPDRAWRRLGESSGIVAGVARDGSLWYWFDRDVASAFERRTGAETIAVQPRPLMRGTRFVDVCLRGVYLHAVDEDGGLWRSDALSPYGADDGSALQGERSELQHIDASARLEHVYCRENASQVLALDSTGRLHGYGMNTFGELGTGDAEYRRPPGAPQATRLQPLSDKRWAAVAVAPGFSLGIAADGSLWGWGRNNDHELGIRHGEPKAPALIDGAHQWVSVVATYGGGIALTADGKLFGWGANASGELGDGGVASRHEEPAPVLTHTQFGGPDAHP